MRGTVASARPARDTCQALAVAAAFVASSSLWTTFTRAVATPWRKAPRVAKVVAAESGRRTARAVLGGAERETDRRPQGGEAYNRDEQDDEDAGDHVHLLGQCPSRRKMLGGPQRDRCHAMVPGAY